MTLKNQKYTYKSGTKNVGMSINDATVDVNIYKNIKVAIQTTYDQGSVEILEGADKVGDAVPSGSQYKVKATATGIYKFSKWMNGSTEVSTENPYTFTSGTEDIDLKAVFVEATKYKLTFKVGEDWTYEEEVYEGQAIGQAWGNAKAKLFGDRPGAYENVDWYDGTTKTVGSELMKSEAWTLTGTVTLKEYTITYAGIDGATITGGPNPTTFTYDTNDFTLINPTKEGWDFTGWSGTGIDDKSMEVKIAKGSTGDRTYTANWEVHRLTIYYILDESKQPGVAPNYNKQYDFGEDVEQPEDPTKDGYTFTGWDQAIPTTMPNNDLTIKAQWQIIDYTIAYNGIDGATIDANPATYNIETADFTLNNPTKKGYNFKGWTGTDLTEATMTVTVKKGSFGNREYTATWEAIEYNITYAFTGVKDAHKEGLEDYLKGLNPTTYTIESEAITLADPQWTGYTFVRWTEGNSIATGSTEDKTFTAEFEINKYKVTFKDDATLNNATLLAEAEYEFDSDLTAIAASLKTVGTDVNGEGAPFTTWAGDKADWTGKVPATDVVYTAVYGGEFTIEFLNEAGTQLQISDPIEYNTAINVTAPADQEKEGYTFKGWFDQDNKEFGTYEKMPAKNLTYKPKFEINQYTMTFVLAGGEVSNSTDDVLITQDFDTDLTAPVPTRKGYNFTGWDAVVPAKIPAESKTFTAQWEIITYNITYTVENGAVFASENPATYTVEDEITLVNPTKTGYTFVGWTGTDLTDKTMEVKIAKGSIGDRAYTANFEINKWKATFTYSDGTQTVIKDVDDVEYGTLIKSIIPADFSETDEGGLPFAAWDPEITDELTMADNDMTFTAIYSGDFDVIFLNEAGAEIDRITVTIPADMPEAIAVPHKTGYVGKWVEKNEGKEYSEYDKMPAKNLTFKPVYTKKTGIHIVFMMPDGIFLQESYMTYGDKIKAPADPTLEGYVFIGWDPEVPATCPEEDTYFVAQFIEDPTVGIQAIMGNATTATVYTMQGVLVGRDMSAEKIATLRSGVYVINGKKVVIK